ncbi:MAG: helix-turn-helix transcriptional regulator [Victivallales bacterium]|nr:helix-turn-helix transcriptional regulator [Victivallales bacterium]
MHQNIIPKETRELFLPLYFSHPATLYLRNNGIILSGISHATKGFEIDRVPPFVLLLFTIGGQAVFYSAGREYTLEPGGLMLAPSGIEQRYVQYGAHDWQFVWFHIEPGAAWDFINIDTPVYGEFSNIEFIKNAMAGLVAEIFSSAPEARFRERPPGDHSETTEWLNEMNEFNIPVPLFNEFSVEMAEKHAELLLRYLQREVHFLLQCKYVEKRHQSKLDKLWEKVARSPDKDWTMKKLSSEVNMSIPNFIRQVKSIYASTPGAVIRQIRLNYAGRLLAESKLPVSAVAEQSGYESMSSFAALFKKHFGKTPKDYQKSFKS